MNNKGTALLVTVLLIGVIGAIAFGVFKIANSELFVGTKQEEGTEAFYAAQAGVEDALMRFKFSDSGRLEIPDGEAREDTEKVLRVNIDNGDFEEVNYEDPIEDPSQYIYDLKAWYKVKEFEITLDKDQSVILDVSDFVKNNNGNLFVRWVPFGEGVDVENSKLWYRLYDPEGATRDLRDDLKRDFFTYLAYYNEGNNPAIGPGAPLENFPPLPPNTPNNPFKTWDFKTLKFKAFGDDNSKIKLIVRTTDNKARIGGPKLYIESTGYHGDTARKLKVTVDRASKSVLDIFDYVIYSGNKPLP